jgi:hypothetical protein
MQPAEWLPVALQQAGSWQPAGWPAQLESGQPLYPLCLRTNHQPLFLLPAEWQRAVSPVVLRVALPPAESRPVE